MAVLFLLFSLFSMLDYCKSNFFFTFIWMAQRLLSICGRAILFFYTFFKILCQNLKGVWPGFYLYIDHGLIYSPCIRQALYYKKTLIYKNIQKVSTKMSKMPKNVLYFLDECKSKMKGDKNFALKAIQESVQLFNKQRCEESKLRCIELYPYQNEKGIEHQLLYVVRIKGRKNSYYQHRILTFYLFFFDGYPQEPPEVVASNVLDTSSNKEKRFQHINVAENGHLCMGINHSKQQYYDYTTLKDILVQLESMIYCPNIESSFNSELFANYKDKGDNTLYYQMLNAQAKFLEFNDSQSQSQDEGQIGWMG